MDLKSRLSAVLQVCEGDTLRFFQSFTKTDVLMTQTKASRFAVPPLTSKVVDLDEIVDAKAILLQTDRPVHVTLTFTPTAPTPAPAPATQTLLVDELLFISSEVSAITVINPNSGASPDHDANIELLMAGT